MGSYTETQPLVHGGPQVIINIDPATSSIQSIEDTFEALSRVQLTQNPQMMVQPANEDPYGTSYGTGRAFNLPDTIDRYDSNYGEFRVTPMTMLAMRMRWGPYNEATMANMLGMPITPFDHMSIHKNKTKAIIFLVKNGEAVTLEDEAALFPSDSLCTRLRMLQDDKPAE